MLTSIFRSDFARPLLPTCSYRPRLGRNRKVTFTMERASADRWPAFQPLTRAALSLMAYWLAGGHCAAPATVTASGALALCRLLLFFAGFGAGL